MANSRTPGELKNCKLENLSLLFGPLAQYIGSDKRRVLSPCVKYNVRDLREKTHPWLKTFWGRRKNWKPRKESEWRASKWRGSEVSCCLWAHKRNL